MQMIKDTGMGSNRGTHMSYNMKGNINQVPPPTPTISPVRDFNAAADCKRLYEDFKGLFGGKDTAIEILCNRSEAQRLEIANCYKRIYGEDLKNKLESKISRNWNHLVNALITSRADYLAQQLNTAMSGMGTNTHVIIEILVSSDNKTMQQINLRYHAKFRKSLESDIEKETSGPFRILCTSLLLGNRVMSPKVDKNLAAYDAQQLKKAGVDRWGTDEAAFIKIMVGKSFEYLKQVFDEYENIAGHSCEEAVKREFSGSTKKCLLAIMKYARDKNVYFAERLYKALERSDDDKLIRNLISRAELDLGDIKMEFRQKYGETLVNVIRREKSGKFKEALLAIIN